MAEITIIGSGMMGSALAFPAKENGNEVNIVGTPLDRDIIENCKKYNRHPKFNTDFPSGINFYHIEDLDNAIKNADIIIGGVSSFGVDWFADFVIPKLPDNSVVLTVTKGLLEEENGRLIPYPFFWQKKAKELKKNISFNAIGGPCTSYELVAHDMTEVTFCGEDTEILKKIKSLMQTDYYHISLSRDIIGIESAVALKNGYALAIALTIGMNQKKYGIDSELHYNSQAAVFGQATKEMEKLLRLFDGYSIDTLAVGVGDLYVTVYGGRTRLVGILLGRGYTIDEAKAELNGVTLESLVVAERVGRALKTRAKLGECSLDDFPLMMTINDILHGSEAFIPWDKFEYNK